MEISKQIKISQFRMAHKYQMHFGKRKETLDESPLDLTCLYCFYPPASLGRRNISKPKGSQDRNTLLHITFLSCYTHALEHVLASDT